MRKQILLFLAVMIGAAQAQSPVVLDDVLMDSFNLALRNGRLQFNKLRAMNLPASADGKACFKVTYKKDGKRLASYTGMPLAPKRNVSWLMNYVRPDDDASSEFLFTEAGEYELEFSVEGKVFDSFKFGIAKHTAKGGEVWTVAEGVWDELAFLSDKDRVPLKFSYWMRDFLEGTGERSHGYGSYTAKIVRVSDGKTVGVSNPEGRETKPPLRQWKKFDIFFMEPGPDRIRLQAKKLLATDGDYYVEFVFEGKVHGRYPFSVAGGAFKGLSEYQGLPLGTDGTVFWCPRQKG